MSSRFFLLTAFILASKALFPQDDLLSLIEEKKEGPKKVYATFKTVRIGNAQTIETVKRNHLDFRISHRFGNVYDNSLPNPLNTMGQTFIGFDNVRDIRFSFDYGLTENITLGIGRSKLNHLIDGSIKWRILQQTTDFSMPISLALFSSTAYSHDPMSVIYGDIVKDFNTSELHRFNFFHQVIIASKLSDWLSLELLPSYMYRNYIRQNINTKNNEYDVNGFFSLGFGGRIKLSKRVSFIGDYFYNFAPYYQNNPKVFNPLSLGFEIETGGHVFSLFVTNAGGLIENNFIPYTTDTWTKGQVKFGFCISRTFAL
jgi:hypothetical protein